MILHISTAEQLQNSDTFYKCESLITEGFIHCSEPDQVVEVADNIFKGQSGLILLVIDPQKVTAPIKYEDAGNGKVYPHIYGPLNLDALIKLVPFEPLAGGRFSLPNELNASHNSWILGRPA